jgi:isoquinoline 1-oxidoreductase beta subunit
MKPLITRREFLKTTAAGAGLTIAAVMTPQGLRLVSAEEAKKEELRALKPMAWLTITQDNIVTITVNKSEMGQGVYTSLPMIVADELDADWKQVRFASAPAGDEYKDPVWKSQSTGGSSSVRNMYGPLRTMGAAMREMLVIAAARTWAVPVKDCAALLGRVKHVKTGRTLTYGALSTEAAQLQVPQNARLKSEKQLRYIGKAVPRMDVQEKSTGKAMFGIDTFVPDMLYAAVARPAAYGAGPGSFDETAARKVGGVRSIIQIPSGVAVCADTIDGAWKGRSALNVKWRNPGSGSMDTASLEKDFVAGMNGQGVVAKNEGDAKLALGRAAKKIEATYLLPYLSHATMEPMNCTASVKPDRCDVWVPTQNQTGVLDMAVKISGLKREQVFVHTTYLGGGFGRRFETDVAEEALRLSKTTGRPVKLLWTREEDMQHDFYRPANYTRIEGGLDDKGQVIAWSHKIVCPSIFSRVFPDRVEKGIDPAAVEGVENMEYEIPNRYSEYVRMDLPVPVGFWRSVGSSHNGFTVESFVDELAHVAGKDPLEFRLGLLKDHPRARRVLETAAKKAGWGKPLKRGQARGIAYHLSFGSYVAEVAEVSVDRKEGKIKVHRVVCAVDCGSVVNPFIVTTQMESGINMGLSAALKEKIEFADGGVKTENFSGYDLLRMGEAPDIDVHIVTSGDKLGGIGEPGVPPIAPAVANAVFAATGIRLRNLPMTPDIVMAAMK